MTPKQLPIEKGMTRLAFTDEEYPARDSEKDTCPNGSGPTHLPPAPIWNPGIHKQLKMDVLPIAAVDEYSGQAVHPLIRYPPEGGGPLEDPIMDLYDPIGQAVQVEVSLSELYPTLHLQREEADSEKEFKGHATQDDAPNDALYVPGLQGKQAFLVWPSFPNDDCGANPIGHSSNVKANVKVEMEGISGTVE